MKFPFFISTYHPEQEVEFTRAFKGLKKQIGTTIQTLEINLYDICMDILNEQLGEGETFELEKQMDKSEFKNALQSVLDINEVVMPYIKSIIDSSTAKSLFYYRCWKRLSISQVA
ncbi:MAG: DUF1788 domain-containing protein [Saprospiraceae bacterium]